MPFLKLKNGLFSKSQSKKSLYLSLTLSIFLCVSVMSINLAFFPGRRIVGSWIKNTGLLFDIIQLLILHFFLWKFNRLTVKTNLRCWIDVGLAIWIISATFDAMDEIILQPAWVGHFIEDVTKLLGMLIVSIGFYFIVLYVNNKYVDASVESFQDELTQLPNRRYFRNVMIDLKDTNHYLMFIDIDFFKKINDKYGHDIGDEVLSVFGRMLKNLHNNNVFAARIGGEEFAVIVHTLKTEDVKLIAKKILTSARQLVIMNDIRFTVSIGVGCKRENETIDNLLKRVDNALYQAKYCGRDRIEWAIC